jgi:glycosyltransferase involved in cell wall biosynthesis
LTQSIANHLTEILRAQFDRVEVLFIIDQLCEMGGAERVLLRIIERLPRDRFSPSVLTFKIDEQLGFRQMMDCPVEVYPLRRTYDRTGLQVARRIARIVRSRRVRIAHTFHETSDLWAGMVAKLSGCPLLISSRRDMGIQRGAGHRLGYRLLSRYFDEVHTVSERVRRFCVEDDGLNASRVVTIYNGVDLPKVSQRIDRDSLRARLGISSDAPLIVSVGNIRPVKGFDVLLRAAAKVRTVLPEAVFVVAGENHDPQHSRELDSLRADLGLERNFHFLGRLKDVTKLLQASNAFCLLSRSEGLSNALLEAMACELPCVATRVGGNPEVIVEGRTGYLVEDQDHESAAARILQLLGKPVEARAMGVEGRLIVEEKFTTEAMMTNVVNSYERLLASAAAR